MMKYKAVMFDLFGTLVEKFPTEDAIIPLREMAAVLGVDAEKLIPLWFDTFYERHAGTYDSLEDDIKYVTGKLGVHPSSGQINKAARIDLDYILANVVLKPGALELLRLLRESGYRTALVSNWSDEIPSVWEDLPLAEYFDVSIFSCRVKIMKPDTRIYQMALEQLSVAAAECLYFGDGDSREIDGARNTGMDAVLIADDRAESWKGMAVSSLAEARMLLEG